MLTEQAELVRELESALDEFPEERDDILLELAEAHATAGQPERAIALLRDMVAEGGTASGLARCALAETLFDLGREDEARAELAALKATRQTDDGGWHLAAELFEVRGELGEALEWFTMAAARLTEDDLAEVAQEFGWSTAGGMLVRSRRRVRRALDLPPDDLDLTLATEQEILGELPSAADLVAHLEGRSTRAPGEVRVLCWQRAELAAAHARWPESLATPDDYHENLERQWLELVEQGVPRVTLVFATVEGMAAEAARLGLSEPDTLVRRAYLESPPTASLFAWPPGRNESCWCGSDRKYKKCCGRPA